jgi:type III secretion protein R
MNAPDPVLLMGSLLVLGLLPFAALMVTSYAKIVIVLGLLRNALGVQQVPPNMVINALAIILSAYVMAPVTAKLTENIDLNNASSMRTGDIVSKLALAKDPLKGFLMKHSAERERYFFIKSAATLWPKEMADQVKSDDFLVLVPAFLITELSEAFMVGFMIYLAFILVDMVIANVLLAMGMSMLSPNIISTPFKLLLFVMLDGWSKLVHGLILSYQ